ncbi:MAG: XrtA/PEP-CTERM system histidine kinase PrsK [Burkholderiaceae bacterium]
MNSELLGFISFAIAALTFGALALLLIARQQTGMTSRLFLLAVIVQAVWAAVMGLGLTVVHVPEFIGTSAEALRTFAWTAFLLSLPFQDDSAQGEFLNVRRLRSAALIMAMICGLSGLVLDLADADLRLVFTARIAAAMFGLVVLEQVYRNASPGKRWSIRFLAVALLAMLGFDLLLFSDALLYSKLNTHWFTARGFANALLAPLFGLAAIRNREWKLDISVSRRVVFHSTALLGSIAYIVMVGLGGYYVRQVGGEWGAVAQALIIFVAATALLILLFSSGMRASLRVLISKHFFDYRYDYREEWLKLTQLLSQPGNTRRQLSGDENLPERALQGMAALVDSAGAGLWLHEPGGLYGFQAALDYNGPTSEIAGDHSIANYLKNRQWVIDLNEFHQDPERYPGLQIPAEFLNKSLWLVVPLLLRDELIGIVVLKNSVAPIPVNWEVRDLLKTAGRQIASHLGVQQATKQLLQSQQFDSFNRLSAFVVHDLKNLVSQLSLLSENAKKHRNNPQFQTDMVETVNNVLQRMQGLLLQLRAGTKPIESPIPIPVTSVLEKATHQKRMSRPSPSLEIDQSLRSASVRAHAERLERVIGHLIQNAVEACSARGQVKVLAHAEAGMAIVEVIDNGKGMSEQFIRNRLFRPFTSSKPNGMGIGTFESREYIREIGGRLDVKSHPGKGTTFRIALPLAENREGVAPDME